MTMHWLDWAVLLCPVLAIVLIAIKTQKHSKSVADFMSANRCAGRYLVCNASGEAGFGAISAVALFEAFYVAGFAVGWWSAISAPVGLLMGLTGYVIYRYRETRVMTLAQFFEVRYSKGFRVLAGLTSFVAGVLNYGIFPAVGARFFVYFCGFPQAVVVGPLTIPTFAILMAIFLSIALFLTLMGGQLTIMVTDCIEGMMSQAFYLIVAVALLLMFRWDQIFTALAARPAGESMLNPFDTRAIKDFNIWYVLIGMFGSLYGSISWQGGHAFRSSAANAHEAKMGGILGSWRGMARGVMLTLLCMCAYTYMHHPDFARGAAEVNASLKVIENPAIQTQMRVPVALSHFLPVGIKGVFLSIMIFALLACDGSYMHSWGGIFIQDVILPFRKKPFTPEQHIRRLRWSIAGVAIFAFLFSLLYRQTGFILMFFALTGAIFAGAGACIVGGLYWKKGTTAGAYTGMILGSSLAVVGLVIQEPGVWSWLHGVARSAVANGLLSASGWGGNLAAHWPAKFPINGQIMYFFSMVAALLGYGLVSLLTCREDFNMDRMLHRGQYAKESFADQPTAAYKFSWKSFIGFDEHFTKGDKILSWSVFCWTMFWFAVFVVGTAWNVYGRPWPLAWWGQYWRITGVTVPFVIGLATLVWFTWGGIRDLRLMFHELRTVKRDTRDDGMVVNHHNLDEEQPESKPAGQ